MSAPSPFRRSTAAFVAIAMLGSTAATAAPAAAPRMVDPLAVVSIFGTADSVAAICAGSSAATAAGTAATTAGQTPGAGCVLPVVDAPPPVVETAPPEALVPPVSTTGGIAAFPLLAGLAAIVGLAAIFLVHDNANSEINLPISP